MIIRMIIKMRKERKHGMKVSHNASWKLSEVQMLHGTGGHKRLLWIIEHIRQCVLRNKQYRQQ